MRAVRDKIPAVNTIEVVIVLQGTDEYKDIEEIPDIPLDRLKDAYAIVIKALTKAANEPPG